MSADLGGGRTDRWALLLAGGDGTRLRALRRDLSGDDRPKQFCRVMGGETLHRKSPANFLSTVEGG
jgi:mannose-1-phosphate guanylyltransferase